jgi:hypothetical protein
MNPAKPGFQRWFNSRLPVCDGHQGERHDHRDFRLFRVRSVSRSRRFCHRPRDRPPGTDVQPVVSSFTFLSLIRARQRVAHRPPQLRPALWPGVLLGGFGFLNARQQQAQIRFSPRASGCGPRFGFGDRSRSTGARNEPRPAAPPVGRGFALRVSPQWLHSCWLLLPAISQTILHEAG